MFSRTRYLALVPVAVTLLLLLTLPSDARAQTTTGAFAVAPIFNARGLASVVFMGGTVEQLEAASLASGANGAWAQDGSGAFQLLVVGGPAFLKDGFKAKFAGGFGVTAITLTRPQTSPTPLPVNTTPARVNVRRSGSGADVAITPDGTKALVTSNQTAGTVSVVSLADYATIAVIPVLRSRRASQSPQTAQGRW